MPNGVPGGVLCVPGGGPGVPDGVAGVPGGVPGVSGGVPGESNALMHTLMRHFIDFAIFSIPQSHHLAESQ